MSEWRTTYYISTHGPREFAAVLRTPVPHAAEVSAIVARLWHLGIAEDAERRRKPWSRAALHAFLCGDPDRQAEAMYEYFANLEDEHRQAAEGVQR